jgi:hypothetical protein
MQTIVNKTFEEIAVGDSASVQRTLQAGDVRAWAAAFGEVDMLVGPGESQGAAGIVTAILTALVGSDLPGPGTSIRTTSVQIKGALPIGAVDEIADGLAHVTQCPRASASGRAELDPLILLGTSFGPAPSTITSAHSP